MNGTFYRPCLVLTNETNMQMIQQYGTSHSDKLTWDLGQLLQLILVSRIPVVWRPFCRITKPSNLKSWDLSLKNVVIIRRCKGAELCITEKKN